MVSFWLSPWYPISLRLGDAGIAPVRSFLPSAYKKQLFVFCSCQSDSGRFINRIKEKKTLARCFRIFGTRYLFCCNTKALFKALPLAPTSSQRVNEKEVKANGERRQQIGRHEFQERGAVSE
jgi:hypothetical protein